MNHKILSWSQASSAWSSMKKTIPRAIKLIFRYTPGYTTLSIILVIILGLLPLATLYIMKLLVDTVTIGVSASDKNFIFQELTILLIIAALLSLISTGGKAFSSYITEFQSLIMTDRVSDLIHDQSLKLDLSYYENAAYHDTLHRAQMSGTSRLGKVVTDLVQIAQNCISIGAVGSLILSFSPLAGAILIGAALPAAGLKVWYSNKSYDLSFSQTEMVRISDYYHQILTNAVYAKELRLFTSGKFFRDRYSSLRLSINYAQLALSRSRAVWDTITQGFITIAVFGSFMIIAFKTIGGDITLGNMVVYFSGFQMCIGYIQSIFGSMNALYEDNLFLTNLFEFLDLKPAISTPENSVPLPSLINEGILLSGVNFIYPGTQKQVLSDIDIKIPKGSIIALVGENGAGKSSLIKLICRLYLPDSGIIAVDGINLSLVNPDEWRKKLSVLFQDYIHYNMSAGENIWIADTSNERDIKKISKASEQAGADRIIEYLPAGYDTMLGRYFTKGEELSLGQWQKIALARVFYRDAEVVILDEPASSLDALAEAEIFNGFKEIIRGKTAILISHRFSTVKMADYIYVLKNGRVIESGTHDQLIVKKGLYSEMYHAQADLYT